MFICSVRAGTIRFFGIVCVALIALAVLVALVPTLEPATAVSGEAITESETVSYENIRSNEDRIAFLASFGWQVDATPTESTTVGIPRSFDKVFAAYNEMQRMQGLDLSGYSGKTVERHTYTVTNYEGYAGTVLANLLIYRGRVIGADICSADVNGFVHGLQKP
ncbi:MAG: DUF4830 domain-containing protein [Clostridia bacterium]|nr:DUF4830 domain-containing protein [Clostridia bacterium]